MIDDDVGDYWCPHACGYRHPTQAGIDWHVRREHPEHEETK